MSDWRETARELLATGMSVNLVSREIGKSEHAIRVNLNLNGAADRYRASQAARGKRALEAPRSAPRVEAAEPSRLKTITLPVVSLAAVPDEPAPARKARAPISARIERPGVSRIREIYQRMIRQGKIPGRDLLSEWRA